MLAETFDVIGVDIYTRQMELAHSNVTEARFITAEISSLDFPRQSFNGAVGRIIFVH